MVEEARMRKDCEYVDSVSWSVVLALRSSLS